jgi:site-specific DNA-methyltransferase (adenine-specific)
VLKDNGSFYFFHNDMSQMIDLMHWIKVNTNFILNSFITWDKCDFRALSWKNPREDNNLRSWFNTCEYCVFYTFQDQTGLDFIDKEYIAPRNPFRKILIKAREKAGYSITEVAKRGTFHGKVNHGGAVTNWEKGYNIPTAEQWDILKTFLPIDEGYNAPRQEYEALRQEYEALRQEYEADRYTHNLDKDHNNLWRHLTTNSGKYHPTEKPIGLISRIIRVSSNPSETVLDPFMGSGTTAISAIRTGRNFIGMEKDPTHYKTATKRVKAELAQLRFDI